MNYYFAPVAEGLGDLLLTLPVLHCLIKTGRPTYLVLRSPKQSGVAQSIPGLAGWLEEPEFLKRKLGVDEQFINLRNHPIITENVMGSDSFFEKFGRLTIVDVIERIAIDLIDNEILRGIDLKQSIPFEFERQSNAAGKILFVPGSAGDFKCWNTSSWIELYDALAEAGLAAAVVGQPEKSPEVKALIDSGLPWISTPTFQAAVDVVSSARAMVSVDTGLLHLAIQQGIPGVGLYLQRSIFVRPEENCFHVVAPDCNKKCLGWIHMPPNPTVTFPVFEDFRFAPCEVASERCMDSISVASVFQAVGRALSLKKDDLGQLKQNL
jgi:hypothetical protein